MCGRYSSSRTAADLAKAFAVDEVAEEEDDVAVSWNVAPTKRVHAVVERAPRDEPEGTPVRQLRAVRWGLVPSWAKDTKIGNRMINARVETLAEKPAFRRAYAKRRCVVPADGYYEWYDLGPAPDGAAGKRRKQPYFIRPRDGGILAMAGLYELWRDPDADADADPWLWSMTIITTEATDDLGRIHDRMPMFIDADDLAAWLDPDPRSPEELSALLVPASPGLLEAYPVSTAVGNVRNDWAGLTDPIQT